MRESMQRKEQSARRFGFPPNRIPFQKSEKIAEKDTGAFRRLMAGRITLEQCCAEIAFNNKLDEVTPNQLINELKIMGWIK